MRKILLLVALLELANSSTMATAAVDERAKKFATGYELLNQHKYQDARRVVEVGLRPHPADAMANKLGLAGEHQARIHQVRENIQQGPPGSAAPTLAAQAHERAMVLVPAGTFLMGSTMGEADELPVHQVYVDAFWMDTYQVSVGHYARFLEATGQDAPPDWPIMNRSPHQRRPVVNVEWADANAYCTWAGKRLPTEAEREKAARGTDGRTYPWGNEHPTKLFANVNREQWNNHNALTPVGTFEEGKSPYGIYDMAGNVWEWVSDWYDPDYYQTSPLKNPTGPPTGQSKVIRGGRGAAARRVCVRRTARPTCRRSEASAPGSAVRRRRRARILLDNFPIKEYLSHGDK